MIYFEKHWVGECFSSRFFISEVLCGQHQVKSGIIRQSLTNCLATVTQLAMKSILINRSAELEALISLLEEVKSRDLLDPETNSGTIACMPFLAQFTDFVATMEQSRLTFHVESTVCASFVFISVMCGRFRCVKPFITCLVEARTRGVKERKQEVLVFPGILFHFQEA